MSFRKRNVALGASNLKSDRIPPASSSSLPLGVSPSPLDGRPTISTGTQSLDQLLGGHAGLPLGSSLLIEENGTTDFAGALLRFYAAEGVVQGHQVHVVGVGEQWGRTLPGLASAPAKEDAKKETTGKNKEKMKIAWRYEKLGDFGMGREGLKASPAPNRAPSAPSNPSDPYSNNSPATTTTTSSSPPQTPFIHSFDLTKRLTPPPTSLPIKYTSPSPTTTTSNPNPYTQILTSLTHTLTTTPPTTLHRLIIPSFLSPLSYSTNSSNSTTDPTTLLPFLHTLRSLLRNHPTRLTVMLSLPLSLHPRTEGLTRWIERLMDGVVELVPFSHGSGLVVDDDDNHNGGKGGVGIGGSGKEEKAQGMVKVHCLPVGTEKGVGVGGGGSGGGGEDLVFVLSRRRFVIRPFWLPPVDGEGDGGGQGIGGGGGGDGGMPSKKDIEF